mmetsp:Transcript_3341/g.4646  ORF Transcript_3341/g.4646 Transcript_3341/m.4646 type:complete len:228 (-) Transcript_3341:1127-1810(-)
MSQEKIDNSHPDMVKKRAVMQRCLEKRKYASDCFFEYQKSNYESLYQYEIKEAEALYEQGVEACREHLLARLDFKRRKLEAARDLTKDRLRAYERGSGKPKKGNSNASALLHLLPATEIRNDLREMARNAFTMVIQSQNTSTDNNKVALTIHPNNKNLILDGTVYNLGDEIIVASNLISNQVKGYICSINPTQLHVRTTSHGRDLRIHMHHFQHGRLSLARLNSISE